MVLGLRKDAMEAVRRAFPGQKFAIDVVSRAFGRPDPTERSQQDSSACGISGTRTPENSADLEQAEHAVQGCDAPPAPVDLGGEAGGGCKRRYGLVDLQPTAHSMMFIMIDIKGSNSNHTQALPWPGLYPTPIAQKTDVVCLLPIAVG
jgi:hypothetical protein